MGPRTGALRRSRTLSTIFVSEPSVGKPTLSRGRLRVVVVAAVVGATVIVAIFRSLAPARIRASYSDWSHWTNATALAEERAAGQRAGSGRLKALWRGHDGSKDRQGQGTTGSSLVDINPATSPEHPEAFLSLSCGSRSLSRSGDSTPPSQHASSSNDAGDLGFARENAVLFGGTGFDVRRVLKRAMRSHLYSAKRVADAQSGAPETSSSKYDGEESFRILVLGGSVSNCRGVDAETSCYHSKVLRWFHDVLPMEGDRDPVSEASTETSDELAVDDLDAQTAAALPKRHERRRVSPSRPRPRRRPSTRLINGSRSATGSAFYAYCFEEEMTLRRKNVDWGKGPDLVIVESGVNDVWPGGEQAMRDFERLLRTLKALPSQPAVIALEAASLLLASTTGAHASPEYLHLPAAHFYDVPVLSAKPVLFGSPAAIAKASDTNALADLFLPDLHHPNERGHALLADILVDYLAEQACRAHAELLDTANQRLSEEFTPHRQPSNARETSIASFGVDPCIDFPRRKEEQTRPLPTRSLFEPFFYPKKKGKSAPKSPGLWKMPQATCTQVGNAKSRIAPIQNKGWRKMAWSRDKQYLVAEKPGATVTYSVKVGSGGTILADWLRSRSYGLGDALVYLDNDRSQAVQIAGYQDFGWSIGVPTELFRDVSPGSHDITFELLPAQDSSHPEEETNFRLISIIST
ncbi:hypothetical protein JCM10908_006084 [Rhodotorula pacifica]|uniref:SGNH/GDSL hydrolase family protein n=1 Tax=Rhodotorula pacifica TaxID=1495444 RepID=UPI003178D451